jgi:hypothetical protein
LFISVFWRRRDAAPTPVNYEKIVCETVPLREAGKRQIENVSGQPCPVRECSATANGFIRIPSAKQALNTDIGHWHGQIRFAGDDPISYRLSRIDPFTPFTPIFSPMRTVALVAFSGLQSRDVSGPLDVFAEANRFLLPDAHYRLEVVDLEHGPLRCSISMTIFADRHFSDAHDAYDLLLVAGGPGLVYQEFSDEIYAWLQGASQKARRFGSICSGGPLQGEKGMVRRGGPPFA